MNENQKMKKALLVVDMQEVCVGKNHAKIFKYDNNLLEDANKIIDENKENIVVYIRNIMKKNLINKLAPFQAYEGSQEIELVKNLHIVSDNVFDKYTGDAFSNKKLEEFLKNNEVNEIEIIGVDGGGCVALTALGACKLGYKVIINTKAVGTIFKIKSQQYKRKLIGLGADFV